MKTIINYIEESKHSFRIFSEANHSFRIKNHLKKSENSFPDLTNFDEHNPLEYQGVKISIETNRDTVLFNKLDDKKRNEIIQTICDIIDELKDDKLYFTIYCSGSNIVIKVCQRYLASPLGWVEFFIDSVIKKAKGCNWVFDSFDFKTQIKDNLKETIQYIKSKI